MPCYAVDAVFALVVGRWKQFSPEYLFDKAQRRAPGAFLASSNDSET